MKDRVILFVCNYFPAHPISTNCMSVIIKSIHIKHFVPYFYSYKKTLIVLVVHIFQVKYVIWARLLLATFLSYYTKYERRLSIIYMALLTVMSGACTCTPPSESFRTNLSSTGNITRPMFWSPYLFFVWADYLDILQYLTTIY